MQRIVISEQNSNAFLVILIFFFLISVLHLMFVDQQFISHFLILLIIFSTVAVKFYGLIKIGSISVLLL
jgi:hypothetical protein